MPKLICNVVGTAKYNTFGVLFFFLTCSLQSLCYIEIDIIISNLTRNQQHSFHVHIYNDLTLEDSGSTGGYFSDPAGSEIAHVLTEDDIQH